MEALDNLKKRASEIRQASEQAEITPERLGSLLWDMLVFYGEPKPDGETRKITINYHLADGTWGTTEPSGAVEVPLGGDLTVKFLPKDGYEVDKFNVDQVQQAKATQYTFSNVQTDHTMYVWFKVEDVPFEPAVDFLQRSDKPDVFYSSMGDCLDAIKADHPGKLTSDVTISCTKKVIEMRGTPNNARFGIWISRMQDWNKNSVYTLTIDGKNLYAVDCKWLGGFDFKNVDNVVAKNLSMLNYCNFSGEYTPEEIAAIMFRGDDDSKIKNVAIHNCKFNGIYKNSAGYKAHTWYCLRFKKTANVVIDSCNFTSAAAVVIFMNGVESAEITRSYLQGDYYVNSVGVGHANILNIASQGGYLKLADNIIDGVGMIEYVCSINNIAELDIHRNEVKNCAGQAFAIAGDMKRLSIDSNLFCGNMTNGQFSYIRRIFGIGNAALVEVKNNTVYLSGQFTMSQEFFSGVFDKLINCNNLYLNKLDRTYAIFNNTGGVREYIAYNNVYASKFWADNPTQRWANFKPIKAEVNDTTRGYIDLSFETRLLDNFKSAGYETGSIALSSSDKVVNFDDGGSDFKLISTLKDMYISNLDHVPEFDLAYAKVVGEVSIGAFNAHGQIWDETTDTTTGYTGVNTIDLSAFTSETSSIIPSDDMVTLKLRLKNRKNFVKTIFTSENGHSFVRYGRVITAVLECASDKNTGIYTADNNYKIQITEQSYE